MSKFGAISKAARRAAIKKRLGKNAPRRGMGDDYNIDKVDKRLLEGRFAEYWDDIEDYPTAPAADRAYLERKARKGRKPKPARSGGDGWLKYVAGTSAAAYGGNKLYQKYRDKDK